MTTQNQTTHSLPPYNPLSLSVLALQNPLPDSILKHTLTRYLSYLLPSLSSLSFIHSLTSERANYTPGTVLDPGDTGEHSHDPCR